MAVHTCDLSEIRLRQQFKKTGASTTNDPGFGCIRLTITTLLLSGSLAVPTAIYSQNLIDQTDNIHVQADSLELNQQTGVQTLSGNVLIIQGNVSITADQIQVSMRNGAITRISGTGTPIQFQQQLNNGVVVRTESNEIDYVTRSWTLIFKGNVTLQRANWQLDSHTVEYNVLKRNFSAVGSGGDHTRTIDTSDARRKRISITFKR